MVHIFLKYLLLKSGKFLFQKSAVSKFGIINITFIWCKLIDKLVIELPYFIEYKCALFYIENDAEIFPAHYTWKVVEEGFKIAFMMNKLAMIISIKIILEG